MAEPGCSPDLAGAQAWTGSVAQVGEFGLIEALAARLPAAPAATVGIGDDSAVLGTPEGNVVAAVDFLLEGRHFRRDWSTGIAPSRAFPPRPSALTQTARGRTVRPRYDTSRLWVLRSRVTGQLPSGRGAELLDLSS